MDKDRARRFQSMTEFTKRLMASSAVAPPPPVQDPSMSMRSAGFPPSVIPQGMGIWRPGYAPTMMTQLVHMAYRRRKRRWTGIRVESSAPFGDESVGYGQCANGDWSVGK